jgi:hypothetical protein
MPRLSHGFHDSAFLPEALEPRVLLSADPILPDNPLWIIPRGAAVIDGVLSEADWQSAGTVFRTQATRANSAVTIRMMYNDSGLFLSAQVQDTDLWADGIGSGAGNRWEVEQDDSITFYFDPDGSRDEFFSGADRAFGINLGNPSDPLNRSDGGIVRRYKYVHGDGAGGAPDVNPGGSFTGAIAYATVVTGTVNNPADVDTGWVTEIFLPWAALNMTGAPAHGTTFGMNFDMIQDNSGGFRDLTDHRDLADRFLVPNFIDDHVQGVQSSYTATQAGIHGPVNYAEAMFIDARAGAHPAAINVTAVSDVSPFGAKLNFAAPAGTTGGLGHVVGYQIRYSTSPIDTEGRWVDAGVFANHYVPRLRGLSESLRIAELAPSTTYFVSIRGVDGAGNLGGLSNSMSFTTGALPAPGYRGNVIPSPNGRTLQFEDGTPFVAVGDHLGISWQYTRTLFPGLVWDNANSQFLNFSDSAHTTAEPIATYLDSLQAHGVNTMRLYLELENTHVVGNPGPLPQGTYWIENTPGVFNPAMQQLVLSALQQAASRGIYLILSPFDTFSYDESFGVEGPWAASRGGPLTTINNYFQDPQTLVLAKARMKTVIDWVAASPARDHLLGWEFLSEWDSYEWTLQTSNNGEAGRETEFRTRAVYVQELARYVKQEDPAHLVMNSTITRDPRGPVARLDFYSRNFDVLTPHLYTNSNDEPVNNPQFDSSIMPAQENGYFTAYWTTNRIDHAPIINGEWGMNRAAWPGGVPQYSASFSQAEDEAIFRTMIWSGLASGQAGMGLRIAADELMFRGMLLTDTMRDLQHTFSNFVNGASLQLDFTDFDYSDLAGRMSVRSGSGKSLLSWGISDGSQGIVYVLQNGNISAGAVADGVVTIDDLRADQVMDIEAWSTAPGTTAPLATISGVFVADGKLQFALPSFTVDVVLKFKARAVAGQTQHLVSINVGNSVVTFGLASDSQPTARILSNFTGTISTQDVSSIAGFRGRALDMTPYVTADGLVHLAVTDSNHHLWIFDGNIGTGAWSATDVTAALSSPGMTGDLTTYQPSWGAIHIAGVDARGHAINYWWAPGLTQWQFSDLTALFNGPTLQKGLAGYVASWDGLNLAGLNAGGEVVVYWWAPGLTAWQTVNMTTAFGGPTLTGQLDAYVTPWGGLNIAGTNAAGHVVTYWWAPGLSQWNVADITAAAGGPVIAAGTEVVVSTDGGINIYGLNGMGDLYQLRWTPSNPVWLSTDVSTVSGGPAPNFPLASAAVGNRLMIAADGAPGNRTVILFSFFLDTLNWQAQVTDLVLAA